MAGGDISALIDAQGLSPRDAIRFFRQKANITTEQFGEVMNEANSRGFHVAGAASDAVVNDFRTAVGRAIAEGKTLDWFKGEFDQIVQRRGWTHSGTPGWRAAIIYETNLSTAYSAGEYAQMTTPEALDIYPYWRYRHHSCPHPRPQHEAWDGTILPANDPWWDTHFTPNGWHCHCTVEPVSERMMRKNGWSVSERPTITYRDWKNPATGQIERVPDGIDPGFAYNPGKAWKDAEAARGDTRLSPVSHVLPPEPVPVHAAPEAMPARPKPSAPHVPGAVPVQVVPPAQREAVQAREIEKLLAPDGHGAVEAGTMHPDVQAALGAQRDGVALSDEQLGKQRVHHPEMLDDEYADLPEMIARPLIAVPSSRPLHVVQFSRRGRQLYRIVIKRTQDGLQNFLQSFSPSNLDKLRRQTAGRTIITGGVPEGEQGDGK